MRQVRCSVSAARSCANSGAFLPGSDGLAERGQFARVLVGGLRRAEQRGRRQRPPQSERPRQQPQRDGRQQTDSERERRQNHEGAIGRKNWRVNSARDANGGGSLRGAREKHLRPFPARPTTGPVLCSSPWIGAWNPVKTGGSRAAVTRDDHPRQATRPEEDAHIFPVRTAAISQSRPQGRGEDGWKGVRESSRPQTRSQNTCSDPHSFRASAIAERPGKNSFAKKE